MFRWVVFWVFTLCSTKNFFQCSGTKCSHCDEWSQHIFLKLWNKYCKWCKNPEDHHLTELSGLSIGLNNDSYQVLILCSVVNWNITLQNNEDFELESNIFIVILASCYIIVSVRWNTYFFIYLLFWSWRWQQKAPPERTHHVSEDLSLYQHYCENQRPHSLFYYGRIFRFDML